MDSLSRALANDKSVNVLVNLYNVDERIQSTSCCLVKICHFLGLEKIGRNKLHAINRVGMLTIYLGNYLSTLFANNQATGRNDMYNAQNCVSANQWRHVKVAGRFLVHQCHKAIRRDIRTLTIIPIYMAVVSGHIGQIMEYSDRWPNCMPDGRGYKGSFGDCQVMSLGKCMFES